MNVGSKCPISWNISRHASSLQLYLHCGIEETGSPGIICRICHHVLRHSSEHGTSSMGLHLLANTQIAKLHKLTESDVTEWTSSTVDDTALVILKRQPCRGITTVSLQRTFIYDMQVNSYWPKWQTKCSKLATKDYQSSEFHQDTWNRYLMSGFVSDYITWNAISNLELRQTYRASHCDLVLPSATTLSNICQTEYALTVYAIKKELPSRNEECLALDGRTSINKRVITSVSASYADRKWELRNVQLTSDLVDSLFISAFNSWSRMTGEGGIYWSEASHAFGGRAWSCWTYLWPFAWIYDW